MDATTLVAADDRLHIDDGNRGDTAPICEREGQKGR
jgi:hypothetical protein